ncbi:hypothetical protein F485_gp293 [Aeromonas phage CC2]|uniref:Uncharacterized protein n=1 Tax=Aeromonas phage CC2 TaxID=1204516 RepID=I6XGH6_9CAUD|nr:hypothetical protein F485_gp293 [Aeromonas phage CC2]AFN39161.1 hypothetical protein CC2_002 [Aeromonas phage CC2]
MKMFSTVTSLLTVRNINFFEFYIKEISSGELSWFTYDGFGYLFKKDTNEFVDCEIDYEDPEEPQQVVDKFINSPCDLPHRFSLVDQINQLQEELKDRLYQDFRFNRDMTDKK